MHIIWETLIRESVHVQAHAALVAVVLRVHTQDPDGGWSCLRVSAESRTTWDRRRAARLVLHYVRGHCVSHIRMAGKGWFRPMHGFHPHAPAFRHRAAATLLGGAMWFWLLVRAKEDGPVLLVCAIQ